MKIIDRAAQPEKGAKAGILSRAKGLLENPSEQNDTRAQELAMTILQRVLDNSFTLFRNHTLEGPDIPIPMILVGPPGLRVIYVSDLKGVYSAKEENWEVLDNNTQRFKMAKPNLLALTSKMARAVQAYLASRDLQLPAVEPVLFFVNAGMHIDMNHPSVRLILADALDRYAAGMAQSAVQLDQTTVQRVVNALTGEQAAQPTENKAVVEIRDSFSFRDDPVKKKPPKLQPAAPREQPEVVKQFNAGLQRINFTSRQWRFLGVMVLVNILLLIVLVVLALIFTT